MRIGIIGQGFVGTAVKEGLKDYYTIDTFDLDESKRDVDYIEDIIDRNDIIFVCVPTPMKKDGTCHTDIVEDVISEINECGNGEVVVIKSTIPPGTTDRLHRKYKNIDVIFNPEFLTEANFIEDFKNQNRIILGGVRRGTTKLRQIYSKVFPHATIVKTGAKHAEMVKYFTNCFLATKVSFANEMKYICDNIDLDYDKVVEYATYDERLGKSHWGVPGPDNDLGFGGHCLPKDLSAMINGFDTLGLLEAVENVNDQVRENRDWEQMKGRAVVDG